MRTIVALLVSLLSLPAFAERGEPSPGLVAEARVRTRQATDLLARREGPAFLARRLEARRRGVAKYAGGWGVLSLRHLATDSEIDPSTAGYAVRLTATMANESFSRVGSHTLYLPLGATIRSVTSGTSPLAYQAQPYPEWDLQVLAISFGSVIHPGESVDVSLEYDGVLECSTDGLLQIKSCVVSPDYTVLTGAMVLPWFGGDASFEHALTYPGHLEATLGGTLVKEELLPDGRRRKQFRGPHFAENFSLLLGAFDVLRERQGGLDVASFTRAGDGPFREAYHAIIREIIDDYSQRYSSYAFDKLEYVATSDDMGFGGMAGNGVLYMAAYNFALDPAAHPAQADTFAHEIGHQWFAYKFPNADYEAPWLTEGLTQYISGIWTGQRYSRFLGRDLDSLWFRNFNDLYLYYVPPERDEALTGPIYSDPSLDMMLYVMLAYYKGPMVANVIAQSMGGPDAFAAAVRRMGAEHAFEAFDTESFRARLEESSGVDLQQVFADWVYGKGYPTYEVRVVDASAETPGQARIAVTRDRRMPGVTELAVWAGEAKATVPVEFGDALTAEVVVPLSGPLRTVRFDPDYKQLRRVKHLPAADLNGNGAVDGVDLLSIAWAQGSRWDDQAASRFYVDADANADGAVDETDLGLALAHFAVPNQ